MGPLNTNMKVLPLKKASEKPPDFFYFQSKMFSETMTIEGTGARKSHFSYPKSKQVLCDQSVIGSSESVLSICRPSKCFLSFLSLLTVKTTWCKPGQLLSLCTFCTCSSSLTVIMLSCNLLGCIESTEYLNI